MTAAVVRFWKGRDLLAEFAVACEAEADFPGQVAAMAAEFQRRFPQESLLGNQIRIEVERLTPTPASPVAGR